MKKYILSFMILSLLLLTGCGKGIFNRNKNIVATCIINTTNEYEGVKVTITNTFTFASDKRMLSSRNYTVEKGYKASDYKERKAFYDTLYQKEEYKDIKYKSYDNELMFTFDQTKNIDYEKLSSQEKPLYRTDGYIQVMEKSGMKCEIKGATREELGLDK